ncbi:hypothetical protein [Candidatus Poriferisodalis sp.]|uniref:hypothetical protein n=1 Tax=Candidatus Poriferisodalis sp. TaxID=3101277 RepID=UPI003B02453E
MDTAPAKIDTHRDATVKIDKLSSASDAYALIESIRELSSESTGPILLDFRSLAQSTKQRLDSHWTEIIANELLTEFVDVDLIVRPPSNPNGRRNLERTGCAFAIKQRPSSTTHIDTNHQTESWPAVDWERTWSPLDSNFRQRIFATQHEPDVLIDGEFVVFLNPHAYAGAEDLDHELTGNQIHRWISQLVRSRREWVSSAHELESRVQAQQRLTRTLGRITYELVSNLAYAFCSRNVVVHTRDGLLQRSYVQLYTTRGGRDSFDRLHFIAADTGFGIVATLLPKLAKATDLEQPDPAELIRRLISRALPPYGRNGGKGYRRITEILQEHGGDLYLTTGSVRTSGEPETIRAHAQYQGAGEAPKLSVCDDQRLGFHGTTAHVILRLGQSE